MRAKASPCLGTVVLVSSERPPWLLEGTRWAGLLSIAWLTYFASVQLASSIACSRNGSSGCRQWYAEHDFQVWAAHPGWLKFAALTMVLWPLLRRRTNGVDLPIVLLVLLWSLAIVIMFSSPEAFGDLE